MSTEEYTPAGIAPREEYIQINVPGVAYSAVFVPLWADDFAPYFEQIAKFRDAYVARFPMPEEAPAAPSAPRPVPRPQATPQAPVQPAGVAVSAGANVVYTANGEPCCSQHKTREGTPRPMKFFEGNGRYPAAWKCTAKKQDGSYCTNKVEAA